MGQPRFRNERDWFCNEIKGDCGGTPHSAGLGPSSFYYAVARPRAHVRVVCITANRCQQTGFCGGTPHSAGLGPSSFYYAVARPRAYVRVVCITANCCQQTGFCGGTPHSPVRAASACESSLQDKFLQTRCSELRGRTESSEAIRRLRTILSFAQNRVRGRQPPL